MDEKLIAEQVKEAVDNLKSNNNAPCPYNFVYAESFPDIISDEDIIKHFEWYGEVVVVDRKHKLWRIGKSFDIKGGKENG